MAAARIAILGCGFTGKRVAHSLLRAGHEVIATARNTLSLSNSSTIAISFDILHLRGSDVLRSWITPETLVLYSIPTVGDFDLTAQILPLVALAQRVIYLSTTGVYGAEREVDEYTLPAPRTRRELLRIEAEQSIQNRFPGSLVLRPAAIYGPHRGIHSAIRDGTYRLAENSDNFVSRIHVDDLATHCIAALFGDVTGAYPVADECPCTSREIAAYCAKLLSLPLPPAVATQQLSETRRADRRVDGSAIRRALNIKLQFPNYRVGIPACIAAEESEIPDIADRAF